MPQVLGAKLVIKIQYTANVTINQLMITKSNEMHRPKQPVADDTNKNEANSQGALSNPGCLLRYMQEY